MLWRTCAIPTGLPVDLEQTHATLVPYVLEEAHEVADAIRHGDDSQLKEELGDLLLQVVLHAQIAREQQRFDLDAIARAISAKLIRRHPHVFGDDEANDSEAVHRSWEAIKAAERAERLGNLPSPLSDQLAEKVRGMPALAGAMTISKKAAKAGFEWDDLDGVWDKVHEELDELKEAVATAIVSTPRRSSAICSSPWSMWRVGATSPPRKAWPAPIDASSIAFRGWKRRPRASSGAQHQGARGAVAGGESRHPRRSPITRCSDQSSSDGR